VTCRLPCVFDRNFAARSLGEQRSRVPDIDHFCEFVEALRPLSARAAYQQRALEAAPHEREAVQAIVEGALQEEHFGPQPCCAIAAQGAQVHVEEARHESACATPRRTRQECMVATLIRTCARFALDFALPPRCAGCGTIVAEVHSFCADCWNKVEFLGESGCRTCGLPLEATEAQTCGVCLAQPPRIARTRAAVAYGDLTRSLAIWLKYGRKVATARTMARYMAPLIQAEGSDPILVPVPLHRARLWQRGFNQSVLVAHELARRLKVRTDPLVLRRLKRTPPLKGMSPQQRRKTVAGAFSVADKSAVAGKTVILIDDVLTTGSTAEACAKALRRAGASRVELITWARVVRPSQLMR